MICDFNISHYITLVLIECITYRIINIKSPCGYN